MNKIKSTQTILRIVGCFVKGKEKRLINCFVRFNDDKRFFFCSFINYIKIILLDLYPFNFFSEILYVIKL